MAVLIAENRLLTLHMYLLGGGNALIKDAALWLLRSQSGFLSC